MVYFLRHGETLWNKTEKWQGISDIDLSNKGILQAQEVAHNLSKVKLTKIFSSDLKRASKTAEIISELFQLEVLTDIRLRERNLGQFEGLTTSEISKLFKRQLDILDIVSMDFPEFGVEPLESEFSRARDFIEDLKAFGSDDILVVSHGITIAIMVSILTGNDFRSRKIGNCEIIEVNLN